jgi:DNA mismatch repair ATPase MutS
MAINAREMGEPPSLLDQLLGLSNDDKVAARGIAPAHPLPTDRMERKYHELFKDVDKLMQQTAKPIAQALRVYVKTNTGPLFALEQEIAFFIAAARLVQRSPVTFCRPEVLPSEARTFAADGLHNIALLLRRDHPPVPSDVRFDDEGRVAVLTGPNSGGKTTFLRNVGLAQVMAQAGLFIPATSARFSPVDRVLTHFPRLETREQGRLAEEAARLRTMLQHSSSNSLVLLNETFSSTAFGEALYLAQDILAAMCLIGVRSVFATHLVELVEHFDEIEGRVDGSSSLFSLVAGIELLADGTAIPTYQITRRQPLGRSYAQEIARRHGISLEQILERRQSGAKSKPEGEASPPHESTVS